MAVAGLIAGLAVSGNLAHAHKGCSHGSPDHRSFTRTTAAIFSTHAHAAHLMPSALLVKFAETEISPQLPLTKPHCAPPPQLPLLRRCRPVSRSENPYPYPNELDPKNNKIQKFLLR
jgi:hypothetical protein